MGVRPLVRPLVRELVRNPLTKNVITARKLKENSGKHHQGTHRIAFLFEIQENSAKFKKIQENSRKFSILLDASLFESNLFSFCFSFFVLSYSASAHTFYLLFFLPSFVP